MRFLDEVLMKQAKILNELMQRTPSTVQKQKSSSCLIHFTLTMQRDF